jgi:hypothetical protein
MDACLDLFEQYELGGISAAEVAEQVGCSKNLAYKALRKMKGVVPPPVTEEAVQNVRYVCDVDVDDELMQQIKVVLGIGYDRIVTILNIIKMVHEGTRERDRE